MFMFLKKLHVVHGIHYEIRKEIPREKALLSKELFLIK